MAIRLETLGNLGFIKVMQPKSVQSKVMQTATVSH